ncbi:MAG: IgGFc-binding protein [Acidimicrobiales bacterium]|nr:IgGFc-binding protein [Acidimicrobiales bacterium]
MGVALATAAAPGSALPVGPTPTPTAPAPSTTTLPPSEADRTPGAPPGLVPPEPQVHYLPYRADQLWTILSSEESGVPSQPIRLIAAAAAPRSGTRVAVDHWEDGYDVDPLGAPGPTTEVTTLGAGGVLDLSDTVDLGLIGSLDPVGAGRPYHDGGDKVVSSQPVSVTAGGWPATTGAVHGGSSAVPDVAHQGTSFTLPVGEDAPFPSGTPTASPFEYTGLVVVATQDATTVTVAGGPAVTLDEGEAHLVDGGLHLGDTVITNRPVAVYLAAGDVDAGYEGRLFDLAPTTSWSDRYVTPVTSTNNSNEVVRAFLYNPLGSALTVTVERSNATTSTVSIPAHGQSSFLLSSDVGARFSAPGRPFTGLLVITTPEVANDSSAAYNWGVPLVPEDELTSSVIVPSGPGSANGTANYNPVWFAAAATTTVYVDRDGDPSTGGSVAPGGRRYDFSCPATALVPRVVADGGAPVCSTPSASTGTKGTGDADMTGAQLFTVDGTRLVAAWGQVPGLNAQNPALDLGAALAPVPEPTPTVSVEKTVYRGHDSGAGCDDGGEVVVGVSGDQVTFCFLVTNTGEVAVGPVSVADPDLGVDEADLDLPLAGDLARLEPGDSVGLSYEATVGGDVVNTVYVTAPALSPTGPPLPVAEAEASDSAVVDEVAPDLWLTTEVYAGHDGGATCGVGGPSLTTVVDAPVTWCFHVTNAGDTRLADVTLDDPALGVTEADLVALSGSLDGLDPGETTTLYLESRVTGAVVSSTTARAVPADPVGEPLPGLDPVEAQASASVSVVGPALTLLTEALDPFTGSNLDADDVVGSPGTNDGVPVVLAVGATTTARFTVANAGDVDISEVEVEGSGCDAPPALVAGDVGVPGVLEVGEVWELTCTVTVGAQGLVIDGVARGVTAFGPVPGSEVHETALLQVAAVGVQVQVRHPGSGDYVDTAVVPPRETASFRIVVANTGEAALGQVAVHSDTVPACDRVLPGVLPAGATSPPIDCVSPPLDSDIVNEVAVSASPVGAGGEAVAEPVRASATASATVDSSTTTTSTTTSTTTTSTTTTSTTSSTSTTTTPGPTTSVTPAPPAVGADGAAAGDGPGGGLLERLPGTGAGRVAPLLGAAALAIAAGLALQRRLR